jgi:hypothetical protein
MLAHLRAQAIAAAGSTIAIDSQAMPTNIGREMRGYRRASAALPGNGQKQRISSQSAFCAVSLIFVVRCHQFFKAP